MSIARSIGSRTPAFDTYVPSLIRLVTAAAAASETIGEGWEPG